LEHEKTATLEQQTISQERYDATLKDVRSSLDERRRAFDILEEEASVMRVRLDRHGLTMSHGEGDESEEGGEDGVTLLTLWKRRQTAVRQAESRAVTETELLKERLSDAEARLSATRTPMFEELKSLRREREEEGEALRESQQLWDDERRRFTEQVDVMEERVRLSEQSIMDQIETLTGEALAVASVRETVQQEEEEWSQRSNAEQASLAERRTAVEEEYSGYVREHAKTVLELQESVVALTDKMNSLSTLTDIVQQTGSDTMKQSHASPRAKYKSLLDEVEMARMSSTRDRDTTTNLKALSAEELQSYRNKFHHMRRLATEQQASLTAEKRALLDQIEEISSATGQRNHAKAIAEHFGAQLGVAEEARRVERKSARKEIDSLRAALSQERERSEKKARQHARELAHQLKLSKQRIVAEAELMQQKEEVEYELSSSIAKIDMKTSQ
jgi:hypothetical protein